MIGRVTRFWRRTAINDPYAEFSDSDFQVLALERLPGNLDTSDSFWGGTIKRCDEVLARIAELRQQYDDVEPRRLRGALLDWLDYFANKARENREDVRTQKRRREIDAFSASQDEKRRRVRALSDALRSDARRDTESRSAQPSQPSDDAAVARVTAENKDSR